MSLSPPKAGGGMGWVTVGMEPLSESYLSYRFQNKRKWLAAPEPRVSRTVVLW